MGEHAAQQCPFGGDTAVALAGNPQVLEVRLPLFLIREMAAPMGKQALQRLLREALLAHVGQGVGVDLVVAVLRTQELEKIDAAFRA